MYGLFFLPSETVNDKVKIIRVFKDQDKDGLSRSKERKYGTDPTKKDTDRDGLTDYEEVETYGTNPRKSDSDGDGASDEKEVAIGTDPLDEDSTPILGMLPLVFYAIVIGIVAVIAIISILLYYFVYSKREQSGS